MCFLSPSSRFLPRWTPVHLVAWPPRCGLYPVLLFLFFSLFIGFLVLLFSQMFLSSWVFPLVYNFRCNPLCLDLLRLPLPTPLLSQSFLLPFVYTTSFRLLSTLLFLLSLNVLPSPECFSYPGLFFCSFVPCSLCVYLLHMSAFFPFVFCTFPQHVLPLLLYPRT